MSIHPTVTTVCMYACMHVCMHACMHACMYGMYVWYVWYGMVWYGTYVRMYVCMLCM